jgi:hypothetical protein
MVELWWTEAGRYGVLPLDDRRYELWWPSPRAFTPRNRSRYVLYPPVAQCRLIGKGELADVAGRDPIFVEKINGSFLTELVGSREHCSA